MRHTQLTLSHVLSTSLLFGIRRGFSHVLRVIPRSVYCVARFETIGDASLRR